MAIRRNILITGASSGLGAGMAREFAARDRNLALCARRGERLASLRGEILAAHPHLRVHCTAADVCDHARVFEAFDGFAEALGSVDRVIVNAGIATGGAVGAGRFEANRRTAETNFVAALAQCEAAMQIFNRQGHGHLVVVSSVAADIALPGAFTAYSASKAAVLTLANGIRASNRNPRIRVTVLQPGFIDSEMTRLAPRAPFKLDGATGARLLAEAIEREPSQAYVPAWPWRPLGAVLRRLPTAVVRHLL